jgi:hypothetical protein
MSILIASDPEPDMDPTKKVRIRKTGSADWSLKNWRCNWYKTSKKHRFLNGKSTVYSAGILSGHS